MKIQNIDDLPLLDDAVLGSVIEALLDHAMQRERTLYWISMAFRTATPRLRAKLQSSLNLDQYQELDKSINSLTPVPLTDIEVAQGWVMYEVCRHLEVSDES